MLEALSKLPFGPQQPVLTRFSVGYMAKSMTLSLDKARQVLGYRPPVTNAESFARYGDWVAKQRASAGR